MSAPRLRFAGELVHVWHQEILDPRHVEGYDGVVNDYFLIRTATFEPRGSLPDAALSAEGITDFGWWSVDELACRNGPDLLGPRALPRLLADLLRVGPPDSPLDIGL